MTSNLGVDFEALPTPARLRRHSPVPLYVQIRDDLARRIESGELQPGSRVPSEPELSRVYGVGRPTVRQAVDLLRRGGVTITVRGSGTFVARDVRRISLLDFDGLTNSLHARGMEVRDQLLATGPVSAPDLEVLTVEPATGWWRALRLRSLRAGGNFEPFCIETDAFNLDLCPAAAALFEASGSVASVLDEGYGFAIASCEVGTRALPASAAGAAELLGLKGSAPVLVMERINRSVAGDALHVAHFVLDTERVPIVERLINPNVNL